MKPAGKLTWQQGKQVAKVHYSIPYIGELNLEVYAKLPKAGKMELTETQREIAIRHAKLLARSFVNAIDRDRGLILE